MFVKFLKVLAIIGVAGFTVFCFAFVLDSDNSIALPKSDPWGIVRDNPLRVNKF